jgi:hypothetical protein
VHHRVGTRTTGHAVASSLVGSQSVRWFVVGGLSGMLAHVQNIKVTTEQFFIYRSTDAVGGTSWIAVECATGCAHHLLSGFNQNFLYKFLQGLLGLGISRERLLQHLALLNYYAIVYIEFKHLLFACFSVLGLLISIKKSGLAVALFYLNLNINPWVFRSSPEQFREMFIK